MSSPLSAFTAVPNPQMLAFMGAQSFIMMYQAGEGWQFGKRKQSAMSNEEFNKQTPLSVMLRQQMELGKAIPSIADSMNSMTPLVGDIVKQYGDFIKQIISVTPQVAQNVFQSLVNPPGAVIPPLFGKELEQLSAGMTQSQMLAYAKYIIAKEAGKWKTPPPELNLDIHKPSTVPGYSVLEAQKRAKDKQIAWEKAQDKLRRDRYEMLKKLPKQKQILPIIPLSEQVAKIKRKPSTSIRMERIRLIRQIAILAKNIKNAWKSTDKKKLAHWNKLMREKQQELTSIIARFDWK